MFIFSDWLRWSVFALKPRYAVPIMEGYKKILLVAGGTQLGYVTAAYISCTLGPVDHQ